MLSAADFFELEGNPLRKLFDDTEFVWEALGNIKSYLGSNLEPNVREVRAGKSQVAQTTVLHNNQVISDGFEIDLSGKKPVIMINGTIAEGASVIHAGSFLMDDDIYIGKNTVIEPSALIKGPALIGDSTEVRHGAYIRGDVIVGNDCVVGHTTEMKSAVMLGGSKAGHFAYIGDSILGKVNLGAGTKLANLKLIDSPVVLKIDSRVYQTGLRKFGAIIADGVETGCNSVTTPGTLLARDVLLYPNVTARGYYHPGSVVKVKQPKEIFIDNRNRKR